MNESLSSQRKLFSSCQVQKWRMSGYRRLLAANTGLCIRRSQFLHTQLQLCCCFFGTPPAAALKHFNKSSPLCQSCKASRKLQAAFFQLSCVLELWSLPILKESGPPAVLLTNMAKKSRSTQAVSIFYESSWVLPWGCPCHSHLKQDRKHTLHTCSTSWKGHRVPGPAGHWFTCTQTIHVSGSLWESVPLGDMSKF